MCTPPRQSLPCTSGGRLRLVVSSGALSRPVSWLECTVTCLRRNAATRDFGRVVYSRTRVHVVYLVPGPWDTTCALVSPGGTSMFVSAFTYVQPRVVPGSSCRRQAGRQAGPSKVPGTRCLRPGGICGHARTH